MNLNWYPGHMVKTRRLINENLKLVDVVFELIDSRIPQSSRNPDIDILVASKPKIVILNKCDLADNNKTAEWKKYFESKGNIVVLVDSISGKGIKQVIDSAKIAAKNRMEFEQNKGRRERAIRAMILGIPNVGKSTIINKLVGTASAKTGDKPGVTRGKQWIRIGNDLELLDMPGILWPKFEEKIGLKLAFTGAIRDEIMDNVELSVILLQQLSYLYPKELMERYKLDSLEFEHYIELLEKIGTKRGAIVSGGKVDHYKASQILLDEFRSAKIGKFTLEMPE